MFKKIIVVLFFACSLYAQNDDKQSVVRSGQEALIDAFMATIEGFRSIPVSDSGNGLRINSDGSTDVFIQDYATAPFHYYLMREDKTDITLVDTVSLGDLTFIASAGHGFSTGDWVSMFENNRYTQSEVLSVSADTVTLTLPFAYTFTPSAMVIRGDVNMNVDADTANQIFSLELREFTIPIDIQHISISLQHGTAGDDSKFGNLAALTNGVYFRRENSRIQNLGNYKNNQEFRDFGAVVDYTDKAGGGNYSTAALLDIKNVYGVVIRMDDRIDDVFKATVRDDLSDLVRFRISLRGQYTQGE